MRKSSHIVSSLVIGLFFSTFSCLAARAQEATAVPNQTARDANSVADSLSAMDAAHPSPEAGTVEEAATASPSSGGAATLAGPPSGSQAGSSSKSTSASSVDQASDNQWHYYGTVYLWVPSMHGTVGLRGYDTNVHVSTGDIFSNFRGGFLGVFTPSYNRFSAPVDVLWMRLRASKPVPSEVFPGYSVRATLNESIVTPKVNYLALNNPKIKVYATAGVRIWHIGTTLSLVPVVNGTFPYRGVTWTDFVAGGRFNLPLGPKASIDILGDAGAGGATLDYQVGSFVSLKLKPKLSAQVGWRYLTEHYGNNGNVLNTTTQGVVFGATYQFK